jgi:hypothetical protein
MAFWAMEEERSLGEEVEMTTMTERRTMSRHRTFKAGKIVLNEGQSVVDCTVRNVSETGATRSCTIAWRRLDRIGVKFQ